MNVYAPISDATSGNMTSKGQVLIPKIVRERVGLVPGAAVMVGVNDRGEAVIVPAHAERRARETADERRTRILSAIESVGGRFATGQSTDEYLAELRGPYDGVL